MSKKVHPQQPPSHDPASDRERRPTSTTTPNRHQKRAAGLRPARYSASQVAEMVTGQAQQQTEKMGALIGSAIGMVLYRLGETQMTVGPEDLNTLAKTHRVEIIPTAEPRTFIYKLVRIAPDDTETQPLALPKSTDNALATAAIYSWIKRDPDAFCNFKAAIGDDQRPPRDREVDLIAAILAALEKVKDHKEGRAEAQDHCAKRNLINAGDWAAGANWPRIIRLLDQPTRAG